MKALIKLYLFITFTSFTTYFFFCDGSDLFFIGLDVGAIVLLLFSCFLGYIGIRREKRSLVIIFMFLISVV